MQWRPQALCIATPPDAHDSYVRLALECGLHHFCEANIWTRHWRQVEQASRERHLVSSPSHTFYFHPLVVELKQLVQQSLGKLHSWQFCLSTYMPDWHPEEGNDYYARRRDTAAAREMVPFELLWLNEVFGDAAAVNGIVGQRAALGNNLEDSWCLQIQLASGAIGQLTVLMGCPTPCRRGVCFGEHGMIEFDLWTGELKCRLNGRSEAPRQFGSQAELIEGIYQQEINAFVDAVRTRAAWPLSYRRASHATAMLAAAELSSLSGKNEKVDGDRQPAPTPDAYEVVHRDLDVGSGRTLPAPLGVRFNLDPLPYETSGGNSD
jgi:predicted dehydrogenase